MNYEKDLTMHAKRAWGKDANGERDRSKRMLIDYAFMRDGVKYYRVYNTPDNTHEKATQADVLVSDVITLD